MSPPRRPPPRALFEGGPMRSSEAPPRRVFEPLKPAPLHVFTARISSRDPDRFDVTAKSGGPAGVPFAPSWAILKPALSARAEERRLRDAGDAFGASRVAHEAWAAYVPAYRAEMQTSWRTNRPAWAALLARPRAVLVCYCVEPDRCHRRLLAGLLTKLGAVDGGELHAEGGEQGSLFGGRG